MPKTRKEKEADVEKLRKLFAEQKSVVFTTLTGVTLKDMTVFRAKMRAAAVTFFVPKKTLLKRVLAGTAYEAFPYDKLQAAFGLAASADDEIVPARMLAAFRKEHEQMEILAGIVDGRIVEAKDVIALAKLPGKQELRGQLVGTIAAPLSGFLSVLTGTLRQFVGVLHAYQEKKATA